VVSQIERPLGGDEKSMDLLIELFATGQSSISTLFINMFKITPSDLNIYSRH